MRIGVVRFPASNGWLYRARVPMLALEAGGHEVVWCDEGFGARELRTLAGCDVVHVYRHYEPHVLRMLQQLREAGVALWWDNDVHIAAIPKSNPRHRDYGGFEGSKIFAEMRRIMETADLVTTASPFLCDLYRRSAGVEHVRVIENHLPNHFLNARSDRRDDDVLVGWTAAQEHRVDAEQLDLRSILERVIRDHPQVRVMTLGISLGLPERYERVRGCELEALAQHDARYDIGIAPVADIPFNRTRSNVKVKEYASAGVPWLASPIGPYEELGEKQGGRLVPDERWYEAIAELVENARLRRKLAKRAARWAKTQTIAENVGEWERALRDALEHARTGRVGLSLPTAPR